MMQTTFKMQFDSLPPCLENFLNKESGWKFKFLKSEIHKASRRFSLISSSVIWRGLWGAKCMAAYILLTFYNQVDQWNRLEQRAQKFFRWIHQSPFICIALKKKLERTITNSLFVYWKGLRNLQKKMRK